MFLVMSLIKNIEDSNQKLQIFLSFNSEKKLIEKAIERNVIIFALFLNRSLEVNFMNHSQIKKVM